MDLTMPSYVEFIPDTIVHTDVLAKDKKEFTNRSISNYRQYTGDMSRITVRARVEAEHIEDFLEWVDLAAGNYFAAYYKDNFGFYEEFDPEGTESYKLFRLAEDQLDLDIISRSPKKYEIYEFNLILEYRYGDTLTALPAGVKPNGLPPFSPYAILGSAPGSVPVKNEPGTSNATPPPSTISAPSSPSTINADYGSGKMTAFLKDGTEVDCPGMEEDSCPDDAGNDYSFNVTIAARPKFILTDPETVDKIEFNFFVNAGDLTGYNTVPDYPASSWAANFSCYKSGTHLGGLANQIRLQWTHGIPSEGGWLPKRLDIDYTTGNKVSVPDNATTSQFGKNPATAWRRLVEEPFELHVTRRGEYRLNRKHNGYTIPYKRAVRFRASYVNDAARGAYGYTTCRFFEEESITPNNPLNLISLALSLLPENLVFRQLSAIIGGGSRFELSMNNPDLGSNPYGLKLAGYVLQAKRQNELSWRTMIRTNDGSLIPSFLGNRGDPVISPGTAVPGAPGTGKTYITIGLPDTSQWEFRIRGIDAIRGAIADIWQTITTRPDLPAEEDPDRSPDEEETPDTIKNGVFFIISTSRSAKFTIDPFRDGTYSMIRSV